VLTAIVEAGLTINSRHLLACAVSNRNVSDPLDAPRDGTPVREGIRAIPFAVPWRELIRDSKCIGSRAPKFNPSRDH
jgi:hypothetical protein